MLSSQSTLILGTPGQFEIDDSRSSTASVSPRGPFETPSSLVSPPGRHCSVGVSATSRRALRSLWSPWYFFGLITGVAVYYLFLLSNGTFQLFAPEMLDQVFDNMLVHLLRGEFTVDREAIGFEAFTRDGKTYAYFGVFPALLRFRLCRLSRSRGLRSLAYLA